MWLNSQQCHVPRPTYRQEKKKTLQILCLISYVVNVGVGPIYNPTPVAATFLSVVEDFGQLQLDDAKLDQC